MTRQTFPLVIFLFLIIFDSLTNGTNNLELKRKSHRSLPIEDHRLSLITGISDIQHFNRALDNILIPRVVGTPEHDRVRDYIVATMKELSWTVELDTFRDQTPNFGVQTFHNIIATLNPKAERFLILACHYDSKYFAQPGFLGATDSAVSCAMMLNIAVVLNKYLELNRQNNDISIKLVFFDGEEAFLEWSPTDSIYGARHLAEKWERESFLPRIDMLILLDLLGAPDPQFYSFFKDTENWYKTMILAEERLASAGFLERYQYSGVSVQQSSSRYFQPSSTGAFIEDDHIPFLKRNVPILHLIPLPFPDIWHTHSDDRSAIDLVTVENLSRILRIFVLEYLQIRV